MAIYPTTGLPLLPKPNVQPQPTPQSPQQKSIPKAVLDIINKAISTGRFGLGDIPIIKKYIPDAGVQDVINKVKTGDGTGGGTKRGYGGYEPPVTPTTTPTPQVPTGSNPQVLPPTAPAVVTPTQQQQQLRQQLDIYKQGLTPAQERSRYAAYIKRLRQTAGTYGQDLNELQEIKRIKAYFQNEEQPTTTPEFTPIKTLKVPTSQTGYITKGTIGEPRQEFVFEGDLAFANPTFYALPSGEIFYATGTGLTRKATPSEEKQFVQSQKVEEKYNPPSVFTNPLERYGYEKGKVVSKYFSGEGFVSGALGTGAGAVSYAMLFPESVAATILKPQETFSSIYELTTSAGREQLSKAFGTSFATSPSYSLGYLGGVLVSGFKGTPETISIAKNKKGVIETKLIGGKIFEESGVNVPSIGEVYGKIKQELPFVKKPKQETPTLDLITRVEPTTRKSSRVFLKDEKGNYVLGVKESGEAISFGGKIEKGQTPATAALAELKQETGLTGIKLKYEGKQVFPEETFYVYTAVVSSDTLKKIIPSSDVSLGIKIVSPSEAKGITGQSFRNPITKGDVRVYELGIINWLESGKEIKPTWMYSDTSQGRFYYGIQSRYDVSGAVQLGYSDLDIELLAHGSEKIPISEGYINSLFMESELLGTKAKVIASKSKRGEKGMYVQPSSTIIADVEGKTAGYIGLSYVGFGKPTSETLKLGIGLKKRGALLFKEPPTSPIRFTTKALKGKEVEQIISVGTEIATLERATKIMIEGKKVRLQPSRIIGREEIPLSKIIATSEEILARERYVRPFPPRISKESSESNREIKRIIKENVSSLYRRERFVEIRNKVIEKSPMELGLKEANLGQKELMGTYRNVKSVYQRETPARGIPREPPPTDFFLPPIRTFRYPKPSGKEKRKGKSRLAYQVLVKRRGKYVSIGGGMPRGQALKFLSTRLQTELARSGRLVQQGMTELPDVGFKPSPQVFRQVRIKRGKQYPLGVDTFIQRTSANLQSFEEKQLLQMARRGF